MYLWHQEVALDVGRSDDPRVFLVRGRACDSLGLVDALRRPSNFKSSRVFESRSTHKDE
jgi:hypothetical protein